jgi:8-oxo-dGTP pyrophosphatase MutT (NUDIX family)
VSPLAGAPGDAAGGAAAPAADAGDPRLDRATPLKPGDAVAAIIVVDGQYLLQLRDNKHGIFFPACWGCFGGGVEARESREQALARELQEELQLDAEPQAFRYFSRFDFDLSFAGLSPIWRYFYELELSRAVIPKLRLGEGSAMQLFDAAAILTGAIPLTPYDGFGLWLHINRARLIS